MHGVGFNERSRSVVAQGVDEKFGYSCVTSLCAKTKYLYVIQSCCHNFGYLPLCVPAGARTDLMVCDTTAVHSLLLLLSSSTRG